MRTFCMSCALLLAACGTARAGAAEEAKAREALPAQVAAYLATTRADLASNTRYPKLQVELISAEMEPGESLVTPFTAEVRYVLEYDDIWHKGTRVVHPFVMTAKWFSGRWEIDPHGHRARKNLTDLHPEKSKILFPNI